MDPPRALALGGDLLAVRSHLGLALGLMAHCDAALACRSFRDQDADWGWLEAALTSSINSASTSITVSSPDAVLFDDHRHRPSDFRSDRTGRATLSAGAVGAYVGAAYWFTSSTSFANPAVTIGRIFSDTFAGIAPDSTPGFMLAQVLGAALGTGLLLALYPDVAQSADAVVVPHDTEQFDPQTAGQGGRSSRG